MMDDLVVATFAKLGTAAPSDVCETFLIRDGLLRSATSSSARFALWQSGWHAVEFYDETGKLLKMVSVRKCLCSSA